MSKKKRKAKRERESSFVCLTRTANSLLTAKEGVAERQSVMTMMMVVVLVVVRMMAQYTPNCPNAPDNNNKHLDHPDTYTYIHTLSPTRQTVQRVCVAGKYKHNSKNRHFSTEQLTHEQDSAVFCQRLRSFIQYYLNCKVSLGVGCDSSLRDRPTDRPTDQRSERQAARQALSGAM